MLIGLLLVVFTARVWGAEGRGFIALIMAAVSLIAILNNVFAGATVAFHTPSYDPYRLLWMASLGSLVTSLLGSFLFLLAEGPGHFFLVLVLSFITSLSGSITYYWLGRNDIGRYNLMTLLPSVLLLLLVACGYFLAGIREMRIYFYSWIAAYATAWFIGFMLIIRDGEKADKKREDWLTLGKSMVHYGFRSELSYFLQFLNYRLAYFFISRSLGLDTLGRFSVAVAVAEGVWIIGKSISAVLYSDVLNLQDEKARIERTIRAAGRGFLLTLPALILLNLLPEKIYPLIFGKAFTGIRELVLYLSPGILAVAVANILGHYFSARGMMNILIAKSSLGLVTTTILLLLLLQRFGLKAACWTIDASYIIVLLYLSIRFLKERKKILFSPA